MPQISFEALVRWRHHNAGLISPLRFIPLAEETGAIVGLGAWVLRTACAQIKQWQIQYPELQQTVISVNVSAQQLLLPDFADQVEQILQETGLAGRYLQLEITESAAVSQPDSIRAKLIRLRSLGVKICVDDFGTGYSQLSYLLTLPIDVLKIDRSFVKEIGSSAKGEEIAKIILSLTQSLELDAIAEGVETVIQLKRLKALGCQKIQGYLFSPPIAAKDVPQFHPLVPEV